MEKTDHENEILPAQSFGHGATQLGVNKAVSEIPCIKCNMMFEFPTGKHDYLAHLFIEHRFVIADVEDIALLEEYLKYWQKEFTGHELEDYCTTLLLDQLPDGTPAKNERYYLLSDILPKDYEVRNKLQQQSLERALAQHQLELNDRNFTKECLYCRDVITGLRADFLQHLFTKHFLQLGKPQNLVYIDELVEKIQHNLENLVCLYCEKIFKDRTILKEHMRKKGHKRINPNNRDYDRFFLSNYRTKTQNVKQPTANKQSYVKSRQQKVLEAGSAREVHSPELATSPQENFERRFAVRNESDESDSDWSDWDEDIGKMPPLNCLYCKYKEESYEALKEHMLSAHNVNFEETMKGLNFYQKIKVVNYVRRQICLLRCVSCNLRCDNEEHLSQHMESEQHFGCGTKKQWDKPEYFFPTYDDDSLLCVLDDTPNDETEDSVVRIISEDTIAQINKDAERLSLENFPYA
ncbi:zinc finger protein 277 [Ceratitis capitata]|uniref:Zinc finger protein 277 n=1 Tax=Ceratitis capitata TaxID=7213 RepID=W8BN12_CERCA|nr:zinc finger protein 277 [Ceratitis capitata]